MCTEPVVPSKLAVLWTSGDREAALNMAFMYARNSKRRGWWSHVALIVWGPSARLLAVDEELKSVVRAMNDEGVELLACKACADNYGVSEALEALGINVKYMGQPLTDYLKDPTWRTVTV